MAARSKLLGSKMTFDSPAKASLYVVGVGGPAAARRCNSCLCFSSGPARPGNSARASRSARGSLRAGPTQPLPRAAPSDACVGARRLRRGRSRLPSRLRRPQRDPAGHPKMTRKEGKAPKPNPQPPQPPNHLRDRTGPPTLNAARRQLSGG